MQQDNQLTTDSALDESPFQQVIPGIPQQSLYPSLAALGTSINTAITPPIPFSRRVINDIEEKQRKVLEDTVEGITRLTNTSPILEVEEQAEEAIVPGITSQARTTQADTQEETLQPESSEIEDTGVKKVDIPRDHKTGPTEVQNTSDTDERGVADLNGGQIEDNGTNPDNNRDDYISDDQDINTAVQDD